MPLDTLCPYCRNPGADLFTPNGDPICQRCDTHFRAEILQRRADAQIAADPIGAPLTFASPRTLLVVGGLVMAGALALGLLEVLLIGRVHLMLIGLLFLGGFAVFARGAQR